MSLSKINEVGQISGIESLPVTPHKSGKLDSLNSTEDPFSFAAKHLKFSPSPVKSAPPTPHSSERKSTLRSLDAALNTSASFSKSAQEIQKRIHKSLISSLKLEQATMPHITSPSQNEVEAQQKNSPLNSSHIRNLEFESPTANNSCLLVDNETPTKNIAHKLVDNNFQAQTVAEFLSNFPALSPSDISKVDLSIKNSPFSPNKENAVATPNDPGLQLSIQQLDVNKPRESVSTVLERNFKTNKENNAASPKAARIELDISDLRSQQLLNLMNKIEDSSSDPLESLKLMSMGFLDSQSLNKGKNDKKLENENSSNTKKTKTTNPVEKNCSKNTFNKASKKSAAPTKTNARKPQQISNNKPKFGNIRQNSSKGTTRQVKQLPQTQVQKSENQELTNTELSPMLKDNLETIKNMESVRKHLHGMLNMKSTSDAALSIVELPNTDSRNINKNIEKLPLTMCDLSAGDGAGMITNATSNIVSMLRGEARSKRTIPQSVEANDPSLFAEKHILSETLEKERYRRQHCEKQIQNLQSKLLEVQQELAVSTSTTRKKDSMIEQLDKTLAQVVSGWKTHESNLIKTVQQLTAENEKLKAETESHKQMVSDLQADLAKSLESLAREQEALKLKEEETLLLKQTFQMKVGEIAHVIDQKNASLEQLIKGKESSIAEIKKLTKQIEEYENRQQEFKQKEQQWNESLSEKTKLHEDNLQQLKDSIKAEQKRSSELETNLSAAHEDFNKMDQLLGQVREELEASRMQNAVDEAKHQATMKRLEAEQKISVEKQVAEKMNKLHKESQEREEQIRENHRHQMSEITADHVEELKKQCVNFEDRLAEKEANCKLILEENRQKFSSILQDRTENMKKQMMLKMQNLFQAHYNETLQLMGSTTGMTPARPLYSAFDRSLNFHMNNSIIDPPKEEDLNSSIPSSFMPASLPFSKPQHLPQESKMTNHFLPEQKSSNFSTFSAFKPMFSTSLVSSQNTFNTATSAFNPVTNITAMSSTVPVVPERAKSPMLSTHMLNYNNPIPIEKPYEYENRDKKFTATTGISKISEPTFSQPSSTFQNEANILAEESLKTNSFIQPEKLSTTAATAIDSLSISRRIANQEERKQNLQHYIELLLQRTPGDPLNVSTTSTVNQDPISSIPQLAFNTPSTICSESPARNVTDENKENKQQLKKMQHPVVESGVALEMVHLLQQSLQQDSGSISNKAGQVVPSNVLRNHPQSSSSAVTKSKAMSIAIKKSPRKQTSVRFADCSNNNNNGLSASQIEQRTLTVKLPSASQSSTLPSMEASDITQMLHSYMQNSTPSGDTKEAAEKLLFYLQESKRHKQPTAASNSSTNPTQNSNKVRSKSATPSKTLPAWR